MNPLGRVLAVVPVPRQYATEGSRFWPEIGATSVILETGQGPRSTETLQSADLDLYVPDQPVSRLAARLEVTDPEPIDGAVAQRVAVTEQLKTTAHGENG